ncbi:phosphoglucosamine mutase [Bryobacter aggregatus]|uniref:phosphoglucosamine mutase n=1 Tax=Bryobacter aggregatus TaxID=360054 RepID=UPI0004E10710|nr:phosphoglucosamine mutase [Bryobacter aggregatus]
MREHKLKVGVSGVRGVVGEFLTPLLAADFAQAFGTYVGHGRVVVGRDTRFTGPMIEHAVVCGLLAAGCEVVRVGVQTTPTIQIYVAETGAVGGIGITASHNPAEWNALKLFNGDGLFFNHYERTELLDLFHQSDFTEATNEEMLGLTVDEESPWKRHIDRVLKHVDVERIRARRFRVAIDGVNGAGSRMSVWFLEQVLGCELHAIHVDPTKTFPREAEPKPETLGELMALVREHGCDIGFGQDPDGDRLAVCDERAEMIDNDDMLALAVEAALSRATGDVVVNLTTSSVIDEVASRFGVRVYRTAVGEANVVERMRAVKALIGGEGSSGGVIFSGTHLCRDSYMAMALLLDRMAGEGKTLSQMNGALPRFHRYGGKVQFAHGKLGGLMLAMEKAHPQAQLERMDGLKLNLPEGWIHLRASNTEPILRVAVESKDAARAKQLFDQSMTLLRS